MSILYTEKDMQEMYQKGHRIGVQDTLLAFGSFVLFAFIILVIALI